MTLGALGTISNLGLMDQNMAIQWVKDNIFAFQGDAQKITIVGHGAGAVSVGLHMLSPYSKSKLQLFLLNSE